MLAPGWWLLLGSVSSHISPEKVQEDMKPGNGSQQLEVCEEVVMYGGSDRTKTSATDRNSVEGGLYLP